MNTRVKTAGEIAAMRTSGKMLAAVLYNLRPHVQGGITTQELSSIAHAELKALGGKPAFLGYYGFPDIICISVNDEVVHGIPSSKKVIEEGDIVSMDFGVTYGGMITDAAISVIAGKTDDPKVAELVKVTERSLLTGIDQLYGGVHVGDVGHAIEGVLNKKGFGIVRDYVGHGVGHQLHEEPNVPNYGANGSGPVVKTNMTIAVEPMATLGGYEVYVDKDGWTVRTKDGSWAAHFEHTVLITDKGAEILTTL
jgi:methionyl aminopeptidase